MRARVRVMTEDVAGVESRSSESWLPRPRGRWTTRRLQLGLHRELNESGGYNHTGTSTTTAAHLLRTCNARQVRSRCRCTRVGELGVRGVRGEGKVLSLPLAHGPPPAPWRESTLDRSGQRWYSSHQGSLQVLTGSRKTSA